MLSLAILCIVSSLKYHGIIMFLTHYLYTYQSLQTNQSHVNLLYYGQTWLFVQSVKNWSMTHSIHYNPGKPQSHGSEFLTCVRVFARLTLYRHIYAHVHIRTRHAYTYTLQGNWSVCVRVFRAWCTHVVLVCTYVCVHGNCTVLIFCPWKYI